MDDKQNIICPNCEHSQEEYITSEGSYWICHHCHEVDFKSENLG